MKRNISIAILFLVIGAIGCKNANEKNSPAQHGADAMPGMDMGKKQEAEIDSSLTHGQNEKNDPGKQSGAIKPGDLDLELEALLKPTNEFVISKIPVIKLRKEEVEIEVDALGEVAYDTRQVGTISSRVSGRIDKLYVRYRYQQVRKGQNILDIYSPELLAAQQNMLFLLKNDSGNDGFIQAAKEKLLLLGMSNQQLKQVIQSGQPLMTIAVYSNYGGHIHDAINAAMKPEPGIMKDISLITGELSLKEGMYVQKGQSVFTIYNPGRAWAVLNIYGESQGLVKTGNKVTITPETAPDKKFQGRIDFIEPFYRKDSKTVTARVYFDNSDLKIPIGSQVNAKIFENTRNAYWLPAEAVVSLGLDKVVFKKVDGGFIVHRINAGIIHNNYVQVLNGVLETDSIAANAQYLMDSESFIKVKN